jgi:hypothetical protein
MVVFWQGPRRVHRMHVAGAWPCMTGRRAAMPSAVGAAFSCAAMATCMCIAASARRPPPAACHVHRHARGWLFAPPTRLSLQPQLSQQPGSAQSAQTNAHLASAVSPNPAGPVAARAHTARATRSTPCSDPSRVVTASSIPDRQQGSARLRHTGGGGEAGEERDRPGRPIAPRLRPTAMHAPTASDMSGETVTQCEKKHMDGDGMKSTSAPMTKLDKHLPTTLSDDVLHMRCCKNQSVSNVLRRQGDWPTKRLQLVERRNVYGEAIRNGQLGTRSAVDAVGGLLGVFRKSKALLSRERWYFCVGYTLTSRHLSTDEGQDRKFTLQASRRRLVFDRASCGEVVGGCLYGTLPQSQP